METTTAFIEAEGITMAAERASHNPNMAEPFEGSNHWVCTFTIEDGRYHPIFFPFSMGPAHMTVTKAAAQHLRRTFGSLAKGWKVGERMPNVVFGGKSVAIAEAEALCTPTSPDAETVLDCLAFDCSGTENARSFEEWADEYGYDHDSRKAEATYRACQETAAKLARFLGEEAFQTLLFNTERL